MIALFFAAQCEELKGNATIWAIIKKPGIKDIDLLCEEGKKTIDGDELYYQNREELPFKFDCNGMQFKDLQKPLRLKGIHILYPFYVSPRMVVQHSFFTIQDDPWRPLDQYYNKNEKFTDIEDIKRFKIPQKARPEIINQLGRLGIDNRTIFPDLDGLAKGLWQLEILRRLNFK